TGRGSTIGQALIDHPLLNGITFTGSENTGEVVAKSAASRNIKFQLEMGGKNPVIVSKDADLDKAVEGVISVAYRSTGQKCTATSRVMVESDVYETFKEKLVEQTKKITVGDGLNEGIWMGPCASNSQFSTVTEYIEIGKNEGASLVYGGEKLSGGD